MVHVQSCSSALAPSILVAPSHHWASAVDPLHQAGDAVVDVGIVALVVDPCRQVSDERVSCLAVNSHCLAMNPGRSVSLGVCKEAVEVYFFWWRCAITLRDAWLLAHLLWHLLLGHLALGTLTLQ